MTQQPALEMPAEPDATSDAGSQNVVDGLFAIARALDRIADALEKDQVVI